jgi:hypothetical protein
MNITYEGAKPGHEEDRVAIIYFNEKEADLADKICDCINGVDSDIPYSASICDLMMTISVDDKEDFEEFKEIYKEIKKKMMCTC